MSRRTGLTWGVVWFGCALGLPFSGEAQTTIVLRAPDSQVVDASIRGGSFANTNYDGGALFTRASSDAEYSRRALLKFDTENLLPAGASIQSARLTVTVSYSNSLTRTLGAYRIGSSWDEVTTTWNARRSGQWWESPGADLAARYAQATAGTSVGSTVTFDVTQLVQESVNGSFGSRYTRIALIDEGDSTSASYKEFYSSEAGDASVRPRLTVTYGDTSSAMDSDSTASDSTSSPIVAASPAPLPASWITADIGAVGASGSASGSFVLAGAGADIWGSTDAFRFAYTSLTGDGSVVTQVQTLDALVSWTKGGVMMRENLAANSRHAFMMVTPGKGLAFQRRTATGGDSSSTGGGGGAAPMWLKLTRAGDVFTSYQSTDGVSWTTVGADTIPMSATIYVGVAVTSHVYGALATATFASTAVTARPASTSTSTSTSSSTTSPLRVLHWNTHHGGIGTDGVYDPARLAAWIAKMNPHVVSLNEVDTTDQVSAIVNALQARTGTAWRSSFSGLGNLVLTSLAVDSQSRCAYPDGVRYAAQLKVTVNGRPLELWSTHLTVDSASARLDEVNAMQTCALDWPEARVIAGDFNMQAGSTEYNQAATGYSDAWVAASALGATINFAGNCDGCTRNSRIDYVFASKGASFLTITSAQIVDTRDADGITPSDHKPMLVTYSVK